MIIRIIKRDIINFIICKIMFVQRVWPRFKVFFLIHKGKVSVSTASSNMRKYDFNNQLTAVKKNG